MKKFIFLVFLNLLYFNPTLAWDGVITAKIKYFDVVTNGDNLGYRIGLENTPTMCGNKHTWAYVTLADSNYQVMVSSLMAAKMADRKVTIYSNVDSRGYCHIGYMRVY